MASMGMPIRRITDGLRRVRPVVAAPEDRGRLSLSRSPYHGLVAEKTVRTSLDVPLGLHRRLHEAAARRGCSARQIILRSIESAVRDAEPQRPKRRLSLDKPIVASTGRPFTLTNEQIYDLVEFP
jgi:hypothetical protein